MIYLYDIFSILFTKEKNFILLITNKITSKNIN